MFANHLGTIRRLIGAAAVVGGLALSSAVSAAPPDRVVGTWNTLVGNEYEIIVIESQGGPGAPGASQCRAVNGTIGIAPVRGFYCPGSGRIHLQHRNLDSHITMRTFNGNVDEDPTTGAMHMAGTFMIMNAVFGDLGEYPFSATR